MRPLALAPMLSLTAALAAAPALADEAWETNLGYAIWEDTRGPDAVLRLYQGEGTEGPVTRLIVPGLGRNTGGGRGSYDALWLSSEGETACAVEVIDPMDGSKTPYWGSAILTFVNPGFPSDWAGVNGDCLAAPTLPLQARALVGEARNRAP
ncbi:hypothetical protein [Pararhodobacter aggregans]